MFFLNPPDSRAHHRFEMAADREISGLTTITYKPYVPYSLRFRSRLLYDQLAAAHVRWLIRRLGAKLDIVWSFDSNLYSDLRWFGATTRIYHPVDQVSETYQKDMAQTADLVVSVSEAILRQLREYGTPTLMVEHGLGREFVDVANTSIGSASYTACSPLKVGYVGNLLNRSVDQRTLKSVLQNHPEIEFHFWGPRFPAESNIAGGDSVEVRRFVEKLSTSANATLHGPVRPADLALQLRKMDLLMICYDAAKDPNRGCNSHKILEYLSTGRVIVANHISDYAGKPGLIEMLPTLDNSKYPDLFDATLANVAAMNSSEPARRRIQYALANSYGRQIARIERELRGLTTTN